MPLDFEAASRALAERRAREGKLTEEKQPLSTAVPDNITLDFPAAENSLRQRRAGAGVLNASQMDADQYTKDAEVGAEMGIPAPLVQADREGFKRQAQVNKGITALSKAPRTAKHMTLDKEALAKSWDDLDILAKAESGWDNLMAGNFDPLVSNLYDASKAATLITEQAKQDPVSLLQAGGKGVVYTVGSMVGGTGALLESVSMPVRTVDEALGLPVGEDVPWWATPSGLLIAAGNEIKDLAEKVGPQEETVGTMLAEALGQLTSQALLAKGVGKYAIAGYAAQGADEQYSRAVDAGATDAERSIATIVGGTITGATEKLPIDFLLRKAPGLGQTLNGFFKDVLLTGSTELIQETTEAFLHNLTAAFTYSENQDLFEGIFQEGALAGGASGIFRSLLLGFRGGAQWRAARKHRGAMDERRATAQESKLYQRDPEAYGRLMDTHMQKAGVDGVFIQADKLQEYFQGEGINKQETLDDWQVDIDDYDAAVQTGGDVKIPNAVYASKIEPTGHLDGIGDHVRMAYDMQTAAEAENDERDHKTALDDTISQLAADVAGGVVTGETQIYNDIRAQLEATGTQTSAVADANARTFAATVAQFARRAGVDPLAYYQQWGVAVRGPQQAAAAAGQLEQAAQPSEPVSTERTAAAEATVEAWSEVSTGSTVSGLEVLEDIPNMASISASLADYEVVGVREVPMDVFSGVGGEPSLAEGIKQSGKLKPLIVVVDGAKDGPAYILEGSHRIDAAADLGLDSIPALVVMDRTELPVQADEGALFQPPVDPTQTPGFQAWFTDSKVVDDDGNPLVVWHGSKEAGFAEFDMEGRGKTAGTGAWFTQSAIGASTYSGTRAEFVPTTPSDVAQSPEEFGVEVEAHDDGTVSAFSPGGAEYVAATAEEAVADMHDQGALFEGQAANIPVYLSIQNPLIIDAEGANWDSIGAELEYFVEDENGEVVGWFTNESDADVFADEFQEEHGYRPDLKEELFRGDAASTDDLVRQAREDGFDGVIIKNVMDEGPHGQGYGWDDTVYVAFAAPQIKATSNVGAFDPTDPRILFQDEGVPRGSFIPRATMQDGQPLTVVNIFQTADLSTFLHESGHLYLEMFKDVAQVPDADPQTVKDFSAILKFLEVDSAAAIDTPQHEKWARAYEAYLFEGTAPSKGLRSAFQRFSSWLRQVYSENVGALNVELTDEIRNVMARMTSSEIEIELARDQLNLEPAFPDAASAAMTDKQYSRYVQEVEDKADEALEALTQRKLREISREKEQVWKEERDAVKDEIRKDLQKDERWNVVSVLTTGSYLDGTEAAGDIKLGRQAFVDAYGLEAVKKFPPGVWSRHNKKYTGGLSPDEAGAVLGFNNGDQFVAQIGNMPQDGKGKTQTYAAFVNSQADEIMRERHGMIEGPTATAASEEALRDVDISQILIKEMRAIAKQLPVGAQLKAIFSQPQDYAEIKQSARDQVQATALRNLRPHQYDAEARRLAKAVTKAVLDGDLQQAASLKVKQIHSTELATASRKAQKQANAQIKAVKKYNTSAQSRAKIAPKYIEAIDTLFEDYDLSSSQTNKELDARTLLNALQGTAEISGTALYVDPELLESAKARSYRDMTPTQITGLADTAHSLAKAGRGESDAESQKRQALYTQGREVADGNVKDLPEEEYQVPRWFGALWAKKGQEVSLVTIKVRTWIEKLDGGRGGWFEKHVIRPVRDAEIEREHRIITEAEVFTGLLEKHYNTGTTKTIFGKKWYTPTEDLNGPRSGKSGVTRFGQQLTREEELAVILNTGNASSLKAVLEQRGPDNSLIFTEDDLARIQDSMTDKDWAFVQDTWDYINSFWPEISDMYRRLYGFAPDKVEAAPIYMNGVKVAEGGYYPLSYDPAISHQASDHIVHEDLKDMDVGSFAPAQTKNGHTIARSGSGGQAVKLALDVITRHVDQVITDITMHESILDVRKLLADKRMRSTIDRKIGKRATGHIEIWLKDVAVQNLINVDTTERVFKNLRTSMTIGAMGWKASTTLVQLSGISHTLAEVGAKPTGRAIVGVLNELRRGKNPFALSQHASAFMRERAILQHRDVADALRTARSKNPTMDAITSTYFWPIVRMQQIVDVITWNAAYDDVLRKRPGISEEDALAFADSTVEAAQGSGLASSLSGIERGTTSENKRMSEFTKAWTTLYSYFNTKLNIAVRKTQATDFKKPDQLVKLTGNYLLLFWLEAAMSDWIYQALSQLGAEDPEETDVETTLGDVAMKQLGYTAQTAMAVVPGLNQVGSVMQGFNAQTAPARSLEEVGRGLQVAASGMQDIYTAWGGDGEYTEDKFLKLVSGMLGITNVLSPVKLPVGQARTGIDALRLYLDEETDNPPAIRYLLRERK